MKVIKFYKIQYLDAGRVWVNANLDVFGYAGDIFHEAWNKHGITAACTSKTKGLQGLKIISKDNPVHIFRLVKVERGLDVITEVAQCKK